jgi:hypothetical protein
MSAPFAQVDMRFELVVEPSGLVGSTPGILLGRKLYLAGEARADLEHEGSLL